MNASGFDRRRDLDSVMSRQKLFLVASVIVLLVGAAFTTYVVKNPREAKTVAPREEGLLVRTTRLKKEEKRILISGFGTVRPRNEVKVVAEVSGRVIFRSEGFRDGGFVKQGEILFVIDPADYKLAIAQRKAEIAQLEADIQRLGQEEKNYKADLAIATRHLDVVQKEVERNRKLHKQGVISPNQLDVSVQAFLRQEREVQATRNSLSLVKPNLAQKRAALEVTETRLQEALLNLERTQFAAPFNARVRGTNLEVGDYIREGNSVGSIYDTSVLEVPVSVPVEDARWIFRRRKVESFPRTQEEVEKFFPRAKVLWSRFGQTFEWDGRVVLVGAGLEETTRALTLTVEVPEPLKKWVPGAYPPLVVGMFVRVIIQGITIPDVFVIPRSALHPGDRIYVFRDGTLNVRPAEVIRKGQDEVVIKNGAHEGERLILSAIPAAVPGMKIRTVDDGPKEARHQGESSP